MQISRFIFVAQNLPISIFSFCSHVKFKKLFLFVQIHFYRSHVSTHYQFHACECWLGAPGALGIRLFIYFCSNRHFYGNFTTIYAVNDFSCSFFQNDFDNTTIFAHRRFRFALVLILIMRWCVQWYPLAVDNI